MCGICGFTSHSNPIAHSVFDAMVDLATHRGPDGRGVYSHENVYLGHRRLIGAAAGGGVSQPFTYDMRCTIVFDGELYNHKDLRHTLEAQGVLFTTESQAELIAAAYACYGTKCCEYLDGSFSFCIHDKAANALFCARDALGIKPFYYLLDEGNRFAFASEIKQLLGLLPAAPRANPSALLHFLALGEMAGTEETLFDGIFQLLPGHSLQIHLPSHTHTLRQWFSLHNQQEDAPHSFADAAARFKQDFTRAVDARLHADTEVGACLSGGLDSSAIVGLASRLQQGAPQSLRTISSCYTQPQYNEESYIDAVVRDTGVQNTKIYPEVPSGTDWLDDMTWHLDAPLASASPYSQWCVFRQAAEMGVQVLLDGQGADEQLGGYAQFIPVWLTELLRQRRFKDFKQELAGYKALHRGRPPVSVASLVCFCGLSACLPKGLVRLFTRVALRLWRSPIYSQKNWLPLILQSPSYQMMSPQQLIDYNMQYQLAHLLHIEDRVSAAHAVIIRVPFLDKQLVQSTYHMPFAYKIRGGVRKAVMRDALKEYLPPEVYARQDKMGFPAPEKEWILHHADWVRTQIGEACRRFPSLLDEKTLLRGFAEYLKNPIPGESVWWRVMAANRWAEVFGITA